MIRNLFICLLFSMLLVACKSSQKSTQASSKEKWTKPSKRQTAQEYIAKYKNDALREMKAYGVPACITLAQGMLESDYGNSELAINANNHFGIKCHKDWSGPTYLKDDNTKDECFRKYRSVLDSYADHSAFLKKGKRYSFLFELKQDDYKGWAEGLKKAGYATDPAYPKRLIKLIEENELQKIN